MAKTLLATKLLAFHTSAAATTLAHNNAALVVVVRRPDAAIPILTDTSLAVVAADDTDNLLLLLLLLLHCFPTVPSSLLLSISLVPPSSSPLPIPRKPGALLVPLLSVPLYQKSFGARCTLLPKLFSPSPSPSCSTPSLLGHFFFRTAARAALQNCGFGASFEELISRLC
jgi:hypothetical protein